MRLHPVGACGRAKVSSFVVVVDRASAHPFQRKPDMVEKPRVMSMIVARQQELVDFGMNEFLTAAIAAVFAIGCRHNAIGNFV